MSIVLFEDRHVAQLDPVAIGKPAFAISCGGQRLVDVAGQAGESIYARVRPHLTAVVAADYPQFATGSPPASDNTLWLNARAVPSAAVCEQLRDLRAQQSAGVIMSGTSVAAAFVPARTTFEPAAEVPVESDFQQLGLPALSADVPLFDYPHDILRHHAATLAANLTARIARGGYKEIAEGVYAAPGAQVGQYVVTDSRHGPIVLEAGATIGPYCLLSGPLHVGRNSRVLEHAALKEGVAIGHTTKIGGEVEASVIEPYTNKQHHGFLGHSYLGSWINLGAGTCNSNLKNTYGTVNMEYHGQKVATGLQFVGAIVGDYAKTAINTGIFTGKTIGVCSMVYGFVTTNVPSFVNYARLFGQVTEAPVEVMVATQRRMFERRGVEQRPCDIELLRAMYQLTVAERRQSGEALSLEPLSL
ncbi:MAG: putative sugar nucleotidyl transferase [Pirellulales bacterium]